MFVVPLATITKKPKDGEPKQIVKRPNFQDFVWMSDKDGDRCTKSAYEKYEEDYETNTEFFETAVAKIPEISSFVHGKDRAKLAIYTEGLEMKPIVACKGFVYFGCENPYLDGQKIDITPLNLLFDGGKAKFAHGVLKMDTGMVYATGMKVSLRIHRQAPRTVHPPPEVEQHEVTWKILGTLFAKSPGGERSGFEPILIVYNAKISKYDYQYEKDESGTKIKLLRQPELPDVAIVEYPRWKFVPLSKVKYITYNKALMLNEDEENIKNIALQGTVPDPEDPKVQTSPEQDDNATDDEATPTEIVPRPTTTNSRGRGRGRSAPAARPRATVPSNSSLKTIESLKRSIEMAESTNASLKTHNEMLKAENVKMEKRIKEAEKLAKEIEGADRFKTSVLEYFQIKYEDTDPKKRPDTFAEFMPKSLQKYFVKGELET